MLDIQFIRDNRELVKEKSSQKGYSVDVDQLLGFDDKRRELLRQVEDLRQQRNDMSSKNHGGRPSDEEVAVGKNIKEQLVALEHQFESVDKEFLELLKNVPNMPLDDVPVGSKEEDNVVTKTVGEQTQFDFLAKSHWEILETKNMLDKERAAKISGSRFAYLKGDIVRLQFAIIQFVMDVLSDQAVIESIIQQNSLDLKAAPFNPVLPPAMLRTEPYVASARLNESDMTYKLANDDLWLNASAEHTLCTMYWNEIIPAEDLPIRYIGYSTSFRREAGTYGKDTEGIIRMHQFDKLEMEVFSSAESGLQEHHLLVAIQEYLISQLGLPYQFIMKCTFDIGKPNARGVDLNVWFPGQSRYIETHTADYMTDYQSRDLKIRTRTTDGAVSFVHTNDATAFALGRTLAAIVENYQTSEGNVRVPEVLIKYMGGRQEI